MKNPLYKVMTRNFNNSKRMRLFIGQVVNTIQIKINNKNKDKNTLMSTDIIKNLDWGNIYSLLELLL